MKYIEAEKLIHDLEERIYAYSEGYATGDNYRKDAIETLLKDVKYQLSLQHEQPKMDIDKELISYYNEHFSPCENGILLSEESGRELDGNDYEYVARHFYELGLNARKEE